MIDNNYILYYQYKSQSIARLKAICRDVFEVVGEAETKKPVYDYIIRLMADHSRFALIDPNGAVIAADLAIKRCSLGEKDGSITIEVFQLKRIA